MTSGRSHFHNRILSLQRAVLAVGREVQRSIADATDAWLRRDCVAGEAVNARTAGWSARARDIELAVYALLATQQPMASDLRRLTALVRLTEEVARSGDLVAHVARSACFERAADDFTPPLRALLVEMATVAASLFGDALAAFEAGTARPPRRWPMPMRSSICSTGSCSRRCSRGRPTPPRPSTWPCWDASTSASVTTPWRSPAA